MERKASKERNELTLRALVLGVLITLIFTAANVFFGLKAGLTFATSIPAAVISMAVLRGFRGTTIQENNIVQTVASSAGTLSAIIFVLPGLVMIGWWNGFPYFTTFAICALGGTLGVMYSIPLRRALVTGSDLPYPEGVACAEVLKVGGHGDAQASDAELATSRMGFRAVLMGGIVSAAFALIVATQVFASDVARYFRFGRNDASASGFDLSLSLALFAVGHLVGLWVGIAMLVGAIIAWGVALPYLTALHPLPGTAEAVATGVWRHQVRFIGAGMIAMASIWTLLTLVRPVAAGLSSALKASRSRHAGRGAALPLTERDIPIGIVGIVTLVCMLPIGILLARFGASAGLGGQAALLVIGGVVYVALMSFFVAAVCGYMAGLIGASNSPLSGVGIIVVIGAALLLVFGVKPFLPASAGPALVAYSLFITAVVFAAATISNDNLQDLKTGQLVGATPWRQQVALIVGVIAGAAIIPPVLVLLNKAYGFAGMPGADSVRALAAPQASMISALAAGVIERNLDWNLIVAGVLIGVALIILDVVLRRTTRAALPPLAVGLGLYLPTSTTLIIVVGAVVGWAYERRAERHPNTQALKQLGVLLASGLIVGESLIGILLAAIVVFSGKDAPLALVGAAFAPYGLALGGGAFAVVVAALYVWIAQRGGGTPAAAVVQETG